MHPWIELATCVIKGPVDQSCGFTFFFMYFITFFLKAKIYKQRKITSSSGKSRILEGQKTFLKLFDSIFEKELYFRMVPLH